MLLNPSANSHSTPSVQKPAYRGRFAPSPTGSLHLGSLFTAVASYLDARWHRGKWLVRIEDIDPPRMEKGAIDSILFCLKQHGLHSDEAPLFQSSRRETYFKTINKLSQNGHTFECYCSRKDLQPPKYQHPPTCQSLGRLDSQLPSIRFTKQSADLRFEDRLHGYQQSSKNLHPFIIKRRDQYPAYHLAVVVDDAYQNITHVVRGFDLLSSTFNQMALQQVLEYSTLKYLHLPLVCNQTGQKLSKQQQALAIDPYRPIENLVQVLNMLNINLAPASEYKKYSPESLLEKAVNYWQPQNLPKTPITTDSR